MTSSARLLYLGFAFPPGVQPLYPGVNPAGHALETQMVAELRHYFEVRSSGILPAKPPLIESADPATGIEHELVLVEKPPELYHRLLSMARLKRQYRQWLASGWAPDAVLVYNLSPIYNQFILWLRRFSNRPRLVLMLLDSSNLGRRLPWLKRARRKLKPMYVPDDEMLSKFDACVGLSKTAAKYFSSPEVPFMWLPGGCTPGRAIRQRQSRQMSEPLRFGYYGSLGAHAGVKELIEVFLRTSRDTVLEICGYGKNGAELAALAEQSPRLKYRGLLTPAECLRFGAQCDVLVNPRPASHGNENNFASKLFDYALSGRAILTSRLSGVEEVLGPEAEYFDPHDFENSLRTALETLSDTPRAELRRRGEAIQTRITSEFSWEVQARRLAGFVEMLCSGKTKLAEPAEALAA